MNMPDAFDRGRAQMRRAAFEKPARFRVLGQNAQGLRGRQAAHRRQDARQYPFILFLLQAADQDPVAVGSPPTPITRVAAARTAAL